MQSVPITTQVVGSNSVHGYAYSIQHYVIKFVNDLQQAGVFFSVLSTNETDLHDIAKILLKVALDTITLTLLSRFEMHGAVLNILRKNIRQFHLCDFKQPK